MKNILFVLAIVLVSSCKSDINERNTPEDTVVGGWQSMEVTDEVLEAAMFAVKNINTKAQLQEVLEVNYQIVKGKNYDLKIQLTDSTIWNATVYKDLKGKFSIHKSAKPLSN